MCLCGFLFLVVTSVSFFLPPTLLPSFLPFLPLLYPSFHSTLSLLLSFQQRSHSLVFLWVFQILSMDHFISHYYCVSDFQVSSAAFIKK